MSEEQINKTVENVEEASEEMKTSNSLTDILNKKVKYAVRDVETYLDYDAALEAFEIQIEIERLNLEIKTLQSQTYKSITESPGEEEIAQRDKLVEHLVELNDDIQDSKAVWTVRGVPPKVWRAMDSKARREFPLAKEADDHTKIDVQLKRNAYVNKEMVRHGVIRVTFADGSEITNISKEDANNFFDDYPEDIAMAVKEKIDELTFANRDFHEEIESADFLSNS